MPVLGQSAVSIPFIPHRFTWRLGDRDTPGHIWPGRDARTGELEGSDESHQGVRAWAIDWLAGPFNLGRRGELVCGDVRNRADDNVRRSAETADGE